MGDESAVACLSRSLSQPSPTPSGDKKGNSLQRALTASVSFGRFTSESLDWEKWSAFTQNRYLEEVERYSKPGSVAEKKAYFEAHYKRRRAEKLLEQQNAAAASNCSETNTTEKVEGINSSLGSDLALRDTCMVTRDIREEEVLDDNTVCHVSHNDSSGTSTERTLETSQIGGVEQVTEPSVLMENPVILENPVQLMSQLENDGNICGDDILPKRENDACKQNDSTTRKSALPNERKHEVSSSKLLKNDSASRNAPSLKPPIMPVQLKNGDKTPKNKKNAESNKKRRSNATSLHMSINFASCSGETRTATSPGLPKISDSRLMRTAIKKYVLPQASTRASVSGVLKHPPTAPPPPENKRSPENKRTITLHSESYSGSRKVDGKLQSQSVNLSKSSSAFGSKSGSSTVSSSFTFKSEERAAKRKEFFQKLEQKLKSKETEKQQPHSKSQVKARNDLKDLRGSVLLQAAKKAEVPPVVEYQNNLTKKIAAVRPCSPKIQERAAFKVHDIASRPPWRFSGKTDSVKDVSIKNNRPPVYGAKSSSAKSMRENASPNIPL